MFFRTLNRLPSILLVLITHLLPNIYPFSRQNQMPSQARANRRCFRMIHRQPRRRPQSKSSQVSLYTIFSSDRAVLFFFFFLLPVCLIYSLPAAKKQLEPRRFNSSSDTRAAKRALRRADCFTVDYKGRKRAARAGPSSPRAAKALCRSRRRRTFVELLYQSKMMEIYWRAEARWLCIMYLLLRRGARCRLHSRRFS